MSILTSIKYAVLEMVEYFFASDMDVVSPEAKKIMANPHDRQLYIEAVEKLKSGESNEETITLSTGTITLS